MVSVKAELIVDCDVHPPTPTTKELLPYLSDHWRETVLGRGITELGLADYPQEAPLSRRADWRDGASDPLKQLQTNCLDAFGTDIAVLHVLHGAPALRSDDLAAAFCRAVNDWTAAEWLDKDSRLRASILVPSSNAELAVGEIERRSGDQRFVGVLLYAGSDGPLGRRQHWPIYAAAIRHQLPILIHPGTVGRFAPTGNGWTSYLIEDHVAYGQAFQAQLLSLVAEGVFTRFPELQVVMLESGFAWLPSFFWRAVKEWRGLRREIPWVDRSPAEIVREKVFVTTQPMEVPPAHLDRIVAQIGADRMFLHSSDYPHWRFKGERPEHSLWPGDLGDRARTRNPIAAFPRLAGARA
jgi:predicted TIM-barrel fold metal-dependent hydrolase